MSAKFRSRPSVTSARSELQLCQKDGADSTLCSDITKVLVDDFSAIFWPRLKIKTIWKPLVQELYSSVDTWPHMYSRNLQ